MSFSTAICGRSKWFAVAVKAEKKRIKRRPLKGVVPKKRKVVLALVAAVEVAVQAPVQVGQEVPAALAVVPVAVPEVLVQIAVVPVGHPEVEIEEDKGGQKPKQANLGPSPDHLEERKEAHLLESLKYM